MLHRAPPYEDPATPGLSLLERENFPIPAPQGVLQQAIPVGVDLP